MYNILFTAMHLPGRLNILSDALSRLQASKFRALMPEADQQPIHIPLLPILPDKDKLQISWWKVL